METSSPRGHTRNRGPVAPRWIPLVLGIDFEGQETHRKNTDIESGSRSDLRMVAENPSWGAPRIHGELLMLGFDISERTISRWMKRAPGSRTRAVLILKTVKPNDNSSATRGRVHR
jgi:hypothetical protein